MMPLLDPHEAVCESLLVIDNASDVGVEVGVQADVFLRLLGERGYTLVSKDGKDALDLLLTKAEQRGWALQPSIVRDALAGSLTAAEIEGV